MRFSRYSLRITRASIIPGAHMTTVTIFKALADETRLRLLRILLHHELSVNELVSILKMGQSRISRHLRVLSDAGLTTFRRDGLWVFYQANQDADVQKFLKTLAHGKEPNSDDREYAEALGKLSELNYRAGYEAGAANKNRKI